MGTVIRSNRDARYTDDNPQGTWRQRAKQLGELNPRNCHRNGEQEGGRERANLHTRNDIVVLQFGQLGC